MSANSSSNGCCAVARPTGLGNQFFKHFHFETSTKCSVRLWDFQVRTSLRWSDRIWRLSSFRHCWFGAWRRCDRSWRRSGEARNCNLCAWECPVTIAASTSMFSKAILPWSCTEVSDARTKFWNSEGWSLLSSLGIQLRIRFTVERCGGFRDTKVTMQWTHRWSRPIEIQ